MKKAEMSALDAYLNRVYKLIIMMPTTAAMMAAICFTVFKIIGWYPTVNPIALAVFDMTNVIYFLTAVWLFKTCTDESGILKQSRLKFGKIFISMVIIIQWNFISYLVPVREFWAYAFFFIVLAVFFFDMKMTVFVTAGIIISIAVSWIIRGDTLLMLPNEYYTPDFILRIICITLSTFTLIVMTHMGGKYLVEELEKYVNYDTLTHLLNRRSMDNYLQAVYQQAKNKKTTFCLMMIDIDDFKKVNDTYGHDCGDAVLKHVAEIISTGVKSNDSVFRWGGEEILVLLNADTDKAIVAAERIRHKIENTPINYRNELSISVTVTIGISPYKGGVSIQGMMDDADAKLYYGKRHGKNQVVSVLPDTQD